MKKVFALCAVILMCTPETVAANPSDQWHLAAWNIEATWQTTRGGGILVAVVDGAVDAEHPDLRGQLLNGSDPAVADSHGTSTTSLIVGSGRGNIYGVAPQAKVLALPSKAVADLPFPDADITIQSIRQAADSPARIINISLAFGTDFPGMRDAVTYAQLRGKLVVAAGGNVDANGPGPVYPAAYPGVVGVSAVGRDGRIWSGSNHGPWISLAAPGVDVVSACTAASRYCSGTGSSASAALVSGVAALVWSAHPDWTAHQVIRRLIETANRGSRQGDEPNDEAGFGVVSPRKALSSSASPGPPDVNPLLGLRGVAPPGASLAPSPPPAGPHVGASASEPAGAPGADERRQPAAGDKPAAERPSAERPWWLFALIPLPLTAVLFLRGRGPRRGGTTGSG